MGLTTLLERRARGDLIETFKVTKGMVSYGTNLYKKSRSGCKLLKNYTCAQFLPNRVANYWSRVPSHVKEAPSVNSFKERLERHKAESLRNDVSSSHYWELSSMLLSKINDTNHDSYVDFMMENPAVAKIKNVNVLNYKRTSYKWINEPI